MLNDRSGGIREPAQCVCWLLAGLVAFPAMAAAANKPHTFAVGDTDFLLDGQRLQIRCGEIHFARVPREYWQHQLQLCKAMGLNTVCAYLFWNFHEFPQGRFDWPGQADAVEFCRLAQQEGLWVILRPGPYACAEWGVTHHLGDGPRYLADLECMLAHNASFSIYMAQ